MLKVKLNLLINLLKTYQRKKKILNIDNNAKTVKGQKFGYKTAIFYGASADSSGFNVCPMATLP